MKPFAVVLLSWIGLFLPNITYSANSSATFNQQSSLQDAMDRLTDKQKHPVIIELTAKPLATLLTPNSNKNGKSQKRPINLLKQQQQTIQLQQTTLINALQKHDPNLRISAKYQQAVNAIVTEMTLDTLRTFTKHPGVKKIQFDETLYINLQSSVPLIGAPTVWQSKDSNQIGVTGVGVTVAVIDTGIDYSHPDLGGGFGAGFKVLGGYDFVNNDTDPMDDNSHGTHVAGTIAGNGEFPGVAPDARLYGLKVCDASGSCRSSHIVAAMDWAIDPDGDPATNDTVDVINMSLGGPGTPESITAVAANNAVDAGIIVVASAGNSGPGPFSVGAPALAEKVIAVAASDKSDNIADFSSRGPVLGVDYIKPDITAPGVDIRAPVMAGGYDSYNGTSMASPHVAGAAALLRQLYPERSVAQIKSQLLHSSKDIDAAPATQGAGRLDLAAAVANPLLISGSFINFNQLDWSADSASQTQSITVTNTSGQNQTLSFTLPTMSTGLSLTASPSGDTNLAAGQTITVDFTLNYTNTDVPLIDLIIHYPILFHTPTTTSRVTINLDITTNLTLRFDDVATLFILNSDDGGIDHLFGLDHLDSNGHVTLNLPVGSYHMISASFLGGISINAQDIELNNATTIDIIKSESKYKLALEQYLSPQQQTQPLDSLALLRGNLFIKHRHAQKYALALSLSRLGPSGQVLLNEMNSDYRLEWEVILKDHRDEVKIIHLANDQQGISKDLWGTLDLSALERLDVGLGNTFIEPDQSVSLWFKTDRFFNWLILEDNIDLAVASLTGPQVIGLYAQAQNSRTIQLDIKGLDGQQIASTQAININEQGFDKREILSWSEKTAKIGFSSTDRQLSLDHQLVYFSGYPHLQLWSDSTTLIIDPLNFFTRQPSLLRDNYHNLYHQPLNYQFSCDDGSTGTGQTDNDSSFFFTTKIELNLACTAVDLTFSYLFSADNQSQGTVNYSNIHDVLVPFISSIELWSAGVATSAIDKIDNQLVIKAEENWIAPFNGELTIDWRLDIAEQWQSLSVEMLSSGVFSAHFPLTTGSQQASIKLAYTNTSGTRLEQIIDNAFLLGSNSKGNPDADNDGINDNVDDDDDNDGILDINDAFPLDPALTSDTDTDGDGITDDIDRDDDNDGVPDEQEIAAGTDPLDANSRPDVDMHWLRLLLKDK